jgi:hypothetical protein
MKTLTSQVSRLAQVMTGSNRSFPQSSQKIPGLYLKLGHKRFHLYLFPIYYLLNHKLDATTSEILQTSLN